MGACAACACVARIDVFVWCLWLWMSWCNGRWALGSPVWSCRLRVAVAGRDKMWRWCPGFGLGAWAEMVVSERKICFGPFDNAMPCIYTRAAPEEGAIWSSHYSSHLVSAGLRPNLSTGCCGRARKASLDRGWACCPNGSGLGLLPLMVLPAETLSNPPLFTTVNKSSFVHHR